MVSETGAVKLLGKPGDRDRLISPGAVSDRLTAQGVRLGAAKSFAELIASAARTLGGAGGPASALIAPGRIEVLGKHTDYCGGRSLLAAAELGIAVVAEPRDDRRITVRNADRGDTIEFDFAADLAPRAGEWSNYPMTVARRLARNFPGALNGANIALASNLPPAAGMSSSSALITGIFLALSAVNRLDECPLWREHLTNREQLAGYCGTIENGQSFGPLAGDRGVGTFGGSEDHTAILCAVPGHLVQYGFCPIRREAVVPMPDGFTFVVMDSGIIAEKTGAALEKYNAVSLKAMKILQIWNESQGRSDATLAQAVRSGPDAKYEIAAVLSARSEHMGLESRFVQFVTESEMVIPHASSALAEHRTADFADLVATSQRSAEADLGNQVSATIELVKLAKADGAIAASAFGAGFGGSVWAMVEQERAADFAATWMRRYADIGGRGRAFATGAGTGVVWV